MYRFFLLFQWFCRIFYKVLKYHLIHYNLSFKPWKYDEIQYQEHFWHYAKQASLEEEIILLKNSFTSDMAQKDQLGGYTLKVNARKEANQIGIVLLC